MDEYLWPARHVAEYAYCPRLFYLMEVEGVYYPSADTEKGKAVHKRVDKPSAANNGNGTKTDDADPESDAVLAAGFIPPVSRGPTHDKNTRARIYGG